MPYRDQSTATSPTHSADQTPGRQPARNGPSIARRGHAARSIPITTSSSVGPCTPCRRATSARRLEGRGDSRLVHPYHHGDLIKVHASQPAGGRATDYADYPAERTPYALRAPDRCTAPA